jgi:branched-subunit amino acid permease
MPEADTIRIEEDISVHIFAASAGMVGVCLTVIGILNIIVKSKSVDTFADDVLTLDAVLFLTSCCLAYAALRSRGAVRAYKVERAADVVFIFGLVMMAVACGAITYSLL